MDVRNLEPHGLPEQIDFRSSFFSGCFPLAKNKLRGRSDGVGALSVRVDRSKRSVGGMAPNN